MPKKTVIPNVIQKLVVRRVQSAKNQLKLRGLVVYKVIEKIQPKLDRDLLRVESS